MKSIPIICPYLLKYLPIIDLVQALRRFSSFVPPSLLMSLSFCSCPNGDDDCPEKVPIHLFDIYENKLNLSSLKCNIDERMISDRISNICQ